MRADCQRRPEKVKTVLRGLPGRFFKPQPEANGAAPSVFRLLFQTCGGGKERLRVILRSQKLYAGQPDGLNQLPLRGQPLVKFRSGPDVGIEKKNGDVHIPAEIVQHIAGAGAAAALQQKPRATSVGGQISQKPVQFFLTVRGQNGVPPR